jgi:hypothetical protein
MLDIKKVIPIVYIEWIDANCNARWFGEGQVDEWCENDWYCNDVGFLIKETEHFIVFAQRHEPDGHANGEEQWGGLHKIPRTWIKNKRILGYISRDGTFNGRRKQDAHK